MYSQPSNQVADLLTVAVRTKEPCLIVAPDQRALAELADEIERQGRVMLDEMNDITMDKPFYLLLSDEVSKIQYDVLAQWQTGSVQIVYGDDFKQTVVEPNVTNGLIIITDEATLQKYSEKGMNIISHIGAVERYTPSYV